MEGRFPYKAKEIRDNYIQMQIKSTPHLFFGKTNQVHNNIYIQHQYEGVQTVPKRNSAYFPVNN